MTLRNSHTHMNLKHFFLMIGAAVAMAGCDSRQEPSVPETTDADAAPAEVQRRAASALEGNWTTVSLTAAGESVEVTGGAITFVGDKMIMKAPGGETTTYRYRVLPSPEPKTIEMTDTRNTNAPPRFAIYEFEGQSLRLDLGDEGKRPAAFGADGSRVFSLRRQ